MPAPNDDLPHPPRFVVLRHDHPALHWDLMLETGHSLRTWRLSAPPAPGAIVDSESIADHRRAYLDYEGPVSGNRGSVQRILSGHYELLADSNRRLEALLNTDAPPLRLIIEPPQGTGIARFENPVVVRPTQNVPR